MSRMREWRRDLCVGTLASIACYVVVGCSQLKTTAPRNVSKSPHDVVEDDLKALVKDLSPSDAEAILLKNGYSVNRYSDAHHEIIVATQDRPIPSASTAILEVNAAITFESGVFTDLIVEEEIIQRP